MTSPSSPCEGCGLRDYIVYSETYCLHNNLQYEPQCMRHGVQNDSAVSLPDFGPFLCKSSASRLSAVHWRSPRDHRWTECNWTNQRCASRCSRRACTGNCASARLTHRVPQKWSDSRHVQWGVGSRELYLYRSSLRVYWEPYTLPVRVWVCAWPQVGCYCGRQCCRHHHNSPNRQFGVNHAKNRLWSVCQFIAISICEYH